MCGTQFLNQIQIGTPNINAVLALRALVSISLKLLLKLKCQVCIL